MGHFSLNFLTSVGGMVMVIDVCLAHLFVKVLMLKEE